MTGAMLSLGLLFLCVSFQRLPVGEAYSDMQNIMGYGRRVISEDLFYALFSFMSGVRHLIWDAGKGFEVETLTRYALVELVASLALTLAVFLCVR
jgi:succinate dehydrogenase / fumarate reductase cytochrome b subunit